MMISAAENTDLLLKNAQSVHIDAMMSWFPDADSIAHWAGPVFRFPFSRETFHKDCRWRDMASYVLVDERDSIQAFGQLYERSGRAHLARISVNPANRNSGVGRVLLQKLLGEGSRTFQLSEFSLFVRRDNPVAYSLYSGAGFTKGEFPKDAPMQDICFYMTRPNSNINTGDG